MKCRRPTRAPHLKGGVTIEARAIPKKVPKRPSDWREATTAAPRRSKGRSAAGTGCSVIKAAAIDPQRPKWKVRGVQVVLQHEDAGEAGAIPWDDDKASQVDTNRNANSGLGNGGEAFRFGEWMALTSETEGFRRSDQDPGNAGSQCQ